MAKKIRSEDLIRGWESQLPAPVAAKDEGYTRKTYLLTPELIADINGIAAANQLPVNELVRFLLNRGVDGIKTGALSLPIKARTVYGLE